MLGLDEVFDAKKAIFEAFRFAKDSSQVGFIQMLKSNNRTLNVNFMDPI